MKRSEGKINLTFVLVLSALLLYPVFVIAAAPPGADLVSLTYHKGTGISVLSRYEVFTSKDGLSWKTSGLSGGGELLTSLTAGAKLLLVGTNSGKILVSADGGDFSTLAQPRDPFGRKVGPIKMLVMGPKGKQIAASSGQGVVRSRDSGKTWEAVRKPFWEEPGARQVLALGFIRKSLVVVTMNGPYLEKSGRFVPFNSGLPVSVRPTAAAFENGKGLLALDGQGLYVSRSTGAWKKVGTAPGDPLAFVGFNKKGFLAARAFSPLNIGDSKGKTWTAITNVSPDFVPVSSESSPMGTFVVLRGKGLVKINGLKFEPAPLPVSLSSIMDEIGIRHIKLAGTQAGVFLSRDGGYSWNDVTPAALGKPVNAFLRLDDGRTLIATDGVGVFVSEDDGSTWKGWSQGLGTANTVRSIVASGDNILAATENGIMVTKTGNKPLWKPLNSKVPRVPVGVIVKSGDSFWAASHSGVFSAGKNLKFKPVKDLRGRTGVLTAEGRKIAVIINRKVLLKDGRKKAVTLPDLPGRALPADLLLFKGTLYAGTNAGPYQFQGNTWKQAGTKTFPVSKLSVSDRGIRVVTSGAGTYYLEH